MSKTVSLSEAQVRLLNNTKLTNFSENSVVGNLLRGFVDIVSTENNFNEADIMSKLISSATGSSLNSIGKLFGISRNQPYYAQGYVTIELNSAMGYSIDNLKDIIKTETGEDVTEIVIPQGTIISNNDKSKQYTVTTDYILTNEGVDCYVLCTEISEDFNVTGNELNNIPYPTPKINAILNYLNIYNKDAIINGTEEESDENYRYRLANFYTANARANETALRLAALSVPGVSDVILEKYKYGIGNTNIIVISQDPITNNGLLAAVEQNVVSVNASSEDITVSAPKYEGITLRCKILFKEDLEDASSKDQIIESIKRNIITYINSLTIGESLNFNEIKNIIINSDSVQSYIIDKLGRGEYIVDTGDIEYADPMLQTNQYLDEQTVFRTNTKLINICY